MGVGNTKGACALCGKEHRRFAHWGQPHLREQVERRVKPVLHLFGHVHDETGFVTIGPTTFVNSAMDIRCKPHRVRIVFDL